MANTERSLSALALLIVRRTNLYSRLSCRSGSSFMPPVPPPSNFCLAHTESMLLVAIEFFMSAWRSGAKRCELMDGIEIFKLLWPFWTENP